MHASHMQIIYNITERAIGRPKDEGGIPLDELGLTGLGLVEALDTIIEGSYIPGLDSLEGTHVTFEGFGNVSRPTAEMLYKY